MTIRGVINVSRENFEGKTESRTLKTIVFQASLQIITPFKFDNIKMDLKEVSQMAITFLSAM
jgi:hypothetical protein